MRSIMPASRRRLSRPGRARHQNQDRAVVGDLTRQPREPERSGVPGLIGNHAHNILTRRVAEKCWRENRPRLWTL